MSQDSPDGVLRCAVVVADRAASAAAPPGVDGRAFALAMCEDVIELVADLAIVTPAVLCLPRGDDGWIADVAALSWPGTPVEGCEPSVAGGEVLAALDLAGRLGANAAVVVTGDVPDLPGLLLGKLFRALGSADLTVSVTSDGDLVGLATRLPRPTWLTPEAAGLDAAAATSCLTRLRSAAPPDATVAEGPAWHRLRASTDVRRLDPGLEGWSSTRAMLTAPRRS